MKIAQIQMKVTADKAENIRHACEMIRAAGQIDLAILPEMFCCPYVGKLFAQYSETEGGAAYQALSTLAKERGIYIVGGTIPEQYGERVYNTCYVFDPAGKCIARHRKTHLFDVCIKNGQVFRESDNLAPGRDLTLFDTPWGKMGLCVCFDMRFEELGRLMALRGAKVIFVPAAFNMTTGPAHWQLLFRQRAVDNQLFTVGASPARDISAGYVAWGHSIVCDPWGTVLTELDETEAVAVTDIDLHRVDEVRAQLPILSARRTDLYTIDTVES